ncbi:MAG: hypothetical protein JSR57_11985, partial [Verrucomicrobia bacterium]|nr:hypothetical protein [Verrucomicrobiota bacterium]
MSNRLLPFLSSCSLILIIGVNADNVNASTNSDGQKPKDNSIEITPPGRPQVKHGANLFITADYLLWKATEQNL